ncbi:hypothetical protein MMC25_002971 [Agyrium rufum]|nr:hypothetical protein [Agyrium rufum]
MAKSTDMCRHMASTGKQEPVGTRLPSQGAVTSSKFDWVQLQKEQSYERTASLEPSQHCIDRGTPSGDLCSTCDLVNEELRFLRARKQTSRRKVPTAYTTTDYLPSSIARRASANEIMPARPKDELRCWSRHIRDNILPQLIQFSSEGHDTRSSSSSSASAISPSAAALFADQRADLSAISSKQADPSGVSPYLSATARNNLNEFLDDLLDDAGSVVDADVLRYSKLHRALAGLAVLGLGWSAASVEKSQALVGRWEGMFGDLRVLRTDLWGRGGRMEGVSHMLEDDAWYDLEGGKEKNHTGLEREPNKKNTRKVGLEEIGNPTAALKTGCLGFEVGSWWIERLGAYRDGIIDYTLKGITADNKRAYAIIMTGLEELHVKADGTIRYRAPPNDTGRFRLMENFVSGSPVRVLRTWKLTSPWRPRAGIRYDGLYKVVAQGVSLFKDPLDKDVWLYTFDLRRIKEQPAIQKALAHPAADEMDDWNEYLRFKAEMMEMKEMDRAQAGQVSFLEIMNQIIP